MLLKIVGLFFVGLAILGVVLPILPTTPFLLVAAACFAKSSPYLYDKLLSNRIFGPMIRDWRAHRSIPKRAKRIALLTMLLALIWSCYRLQHWYWQALVLVLIVPPAIFVARLPLSEHIKESKSSNKC
ncbi:YbaN family protein [Endozoicomonas sp. G2_1]|uniref:YbaN family protein n=1 Tax=Endozoicomonas sp. G2_1 TaxID=2821091 RepID=UPI001ADCE621|nr:YbaN family protein [Endozoicomonas sp. G2_1]MBO9490087.1 YbaN family protein [Endozoicomonas sp. G2_1]